MVKKFPISPRSHEVDEIAVRTFKHRCLDKWITDKPEHDYGWDYLVRIKEDEEVRGYSFYVQIKGSDSPIYIEKNRYVSQRIKTSTINYLLDLFEPSILCLCDTSKSNKPIYWVWFQDAIKTINKTKPNWRDQNTIAIHIPTSNMFMKAKHSEIESYAKKYIDDFHIEREIGSVVASHYGLKDEIYQPKRDRIHKEICKDIYKDLEHHGIIEVTEEDEPDLKPLSKEDREILKVIRGSSSFLDSFYDLEAKNKLDSITQKINKASDGIKAKYYNNLGVLALHENNKLKARGYFKKSYELRTKNTKYLTNLLFSQYQIALESGYLEKNLPPDWEEKLNYVLIQDKESHQAIFLKARWLAATNSFNNAVKLIKGSTAWKKNIIDSRLILVELFLNKNKYQEALQQLEGIEKKVLKKDERFWTTFGYILFILSIGEDKILQEMSLQGPGPPNINQSYLIRAEKCYEEALKLFATKGMPKLAEQSVVNYSAILLLQGKHKRCVEICQLYLSQHPNSIPVLENIVPALSFQKDRKSLEFAIYYGEKAFKLKPKQTGTFCNFLLSLLLAEDYEEIIKLVTIRDVDGFYDKKEEGLSRRLLSISYFEIGNYEESQKLINLMKQDPGLFVEGIIAVAEIAKRSSKPITEIVKILKTGLKHRKYDLSLLTYLVLNLQIKNDNDAYEIIESLSKISVQRELLSGEYELLGKAYLILNKSEEAHTVFYKGHNRYPDELHFLYLTAICLYAQGREEDAYSCLKTFIKKTKKSYSLLYNLALLALDIGKLDESIELLEKALKKTDDIKERGKLHCLLHELKIRLKRPKKEILSHVVEYGKTVEEDVQAEARFLIMFLMAPQFEEKDIDSEIKIWIKEFNDRLNKFSKEHPNFDALRTLKIPKDISEEEKGRYFLIQLAYITLPYRLKIAPFQLAIKSQPWPFVLRAQYLLGASSVFDFWTICKNSNDFSHAIHIWRPINNMDIENKNCKEAQEIFIDLNSLLTLAELDLLDSLGLIFKRINIAYGTKLAIDYALTFSFKKLPLLEKIDKWRLRNLKIIRIKRLKAIDFDGINKNQIEVNRKISLPEKKSIDEMIGFGVGESLLLSEQTGMMLYSDDSLIREWGNSNHNVKSFSTLSFVYLLKEKGYLSIDKETHIYSEMINKNFRIIPFQPYHLMNRLEAIVKKRTQANLTSPKSQDLMNDPILGTFLRQFGETSIPILTRAMLAIDFWISIIQSKDKIRELIAECMQYISFCLSQHSMFRVLTGGRKEENEINATILWAVFWWKCNVSNPNLSCFAWYAIKESCKRFPLKHYKIDKILYELLPYYVIKATNEERGMNKDQKISFILKLTGCLKYEVADRQKLEERFSKLISQIN